LQVADQQGEIGHSRHFDDRGGGTASVVGVGDRHVHRGMMGQMARLAGEGLQLIEKVVNEHHEIPGGLVFASGRSLLEDRPERPGTACTRFIAGGRGRGPGGLEEP